MAAIRAHDLGASLNAIAPIANRQLAEEIRQFGAVLGGGATETLASRLKKIKPPQSYPIGLCEALTATEAAFRALGAKSQAESIRSVLALFSGSAGGSAEQFIAHLGASLAAAKKSTRQKKQAATTADPILAQEISNALTHNVLNPSSFSALVDRLRKPKEVPTPTLHAIANQFLGNKKTYKGRKDPIAEIEKRHDQEMGIVATDKALKRIRV